MATSTFIPTVWSETLLTELDHEYVGVRNCNREFEGDIKEKGSDVKILGLNNIAVFDYYKDCDMSFSQSLAPNNEFTLNINQAKAFNFILDDVDRAQAQPKIMKAAMHQAAISLADMADKYVYKLYSQSPIENRLTIDEINSDKIFEAIIEARQKLFANGVNSSIETSLEVSPEVASHILRAKILNSTDNGETMENGLIGKLFGFNIYVSNNIAIDSEGRHKCFVRTKRAIAFAEQLNEVEAYRPEKRFADAVKGLHLYGAKVVYPNEFVLLDIAL